jgi:predicted dehydrogenase
LDRKDVDAVLISTPDHWHAPIMIAAVAAGKDVYVEKPISNSIDASVQMLEAGRKSDRVIQVGLQQRSWNHFQEAAKIVMDGQIGRVTYCHTVYANYMPPAIAAPAQPVPESLDWDMFQGPAEKRPYTPARQRGWRAYYAYGGGMITDWGVHLIDIAHWYMKADQKTPQLTSATSGYFGVENPDKEQTPGSFLINWQYDDFLMTFNNSEIPNVDDPKFPLWGTYFHGDKGVLLVNRLGYKIMAKKPFARPGQPAPPTIESKTYLNPLGWRADATPEHVRNFLDCVKSRQQPICNIEVGFHSTLPSLTGLLAIRTGKQYTWDGKAAKAV